MEKSRIENRNVEESIVQILSEGEKSQDRWAIGLEMEHFIMKPDMSGPVPYDGEDGIGQILEQLKKNAVSEKYEDGFLTGLYFPDYSLTLEPGAQIEISMRPFQDISEIRSTYLGFEKMLDQAIQPKGYKKICRGYLPSGSVTDVGIIPGERYHALDAWFQKTGTMGRNMMRGTASVQFSIDYSDETDFVRKSRAAYLLSPILQLLTFNSPVFEGRNNRDWMIRARIWEHTDPKRAGMIPGLFDDGYGYRAYAAYASSQPLYFMDRDLAPERQHLAQIYPLVRAKGNCLEIRLADGMPLEYALSYLVLCKALLYSEQNLQELLEKFGYGEDGIRESANSIAKDGYGGLAYGQPVKDAVHFLYSLAETAMDDREKAMAEPLRRLADSGKTLAEIEL